MRRPICKKGGLCTDYLNTLILSRRRVCEMHCQNIIRMVDGHIRPFRRIAVIIASLASSSDDLPSVLDRVLLWTEKAAAKPRLKGLELSGEIDRF